MGGRAHFASIIAVSAAAFGLREYAPVTGPTAVQTGPYDWLIPSTALIVLLSCDWAETFEVR